MPWIATPYNENRFKLGEKYKIKSLPTLLVMNKDGTIADRKGKTHVFKYYKHP